MAVPKYYCENENLTRANHFDAGSDIKSGENINIPANGKALVKTNTFVAIPEGYVGILKSRSGMAAKHDIEVGAGTIDAPFRGQVKVLLRNLSDKDYQVEAGNRIAQMLVVPVLLSNFMRVDSIEKLGDTTRGVNGFGSSGR